MSDLPDAPTLDAVIAHRFSRRDLMRGSLAAALAAGVAPQAAAAPADRPSFDFPELAAGVDEHLHVAEGYEAKPLLRWGDPLFADAPAFDPKKQSGAAQERQFGYNNDFVGFIPLDTEGRQIPQRRHLHEGLERVLTPEPREDRRERQQRPQHKQREIPDGTPE